MYTHGMYTIQQLRETAYVCTDICDDMLCIVALQPHTYTYHILHIHAHSDTYIHIPICAYR